MWTEHHVHIDAQNMHTEHTKYRHSIFASSKSM
jgi:hypothetical protein